MKKNIGSVQITIVCTMLIVCLGKIHAQQFRRTLADKYFSQLYYNEAAPIYEDLARITIKTTNAKKKDWDAVRKAAVSYRKMGNYKESEKWYAQLEKSGTMSATDKVDYIYVLRYNQKYKEAEEKVDELHSTNLDSAIAPYYLQKNYVADLMADSGRYTLKEVEFNSGMGDFAPSYFENGLVYSSKKRNTGFLNIPDPWNGDCFTDSYYARKDGEQGSTFKKKSKLLKKPFKTKRHDGPVFFNSAGNMAFITRNDLSKLKKKDRIQLKLYIVRKNSKGKWGKAEEFTYNSKDKSYSVGHAVLSEDEKVLYFASDRPGGMGGVDIYSCKWNGAGWDEPQNLGPGVNTPGDEMFPFISKAGKLFFASNGHVGLGGLDIFRADKAGNTFSDAVNMGYPVNTSYDDFGLIVDSTEKSGFFTSNRKDNIDRIYGTTIKWPEFFMNGIVVSNDGKNTPLPNTDITVLDIRKNEPVIVRTDSNGRFNVKLDPNSDYQVSANKQNYVLDKSVQVSTRNKNESEEIPVQIILNPTRIPFKGVVTDKASGVPVANSTVEIKDKETGAIVELTSGENGEVDTILDRNHEYEIYSHKKGYQKFNGNFTTGDNREQEKEIPIGLVKMHVGDQFTVKDIYFDYNKATLRDTSKQELDKLASFLMENDNIKVELGSHTDSRGSDTYNKSLSQKRAQSCVDYLIQRGVKKENIVAVGYGETQPVNRCKNGVQCTEDEYQQNRRTNVKILKVMD